MASSCFAEALVAFVVSDVFVQQGFDLLSSCSTALSLLLLLYSFNFKTWSFTAFWQFCKQLLLVLYVGMGRVLVDSHCISVGRTDVSPGQSKVEMENSFYLTWTCCFQHQLLGSRSAYMSQVGYRLQPLCAASAVLTSYIQGDIGGFGQVRDELQGRRLPMQLLVSMLISFSSAS